ncbi:hypothetical protein G6F56_009777 [Rhizopus delemar]|nr:hypothetical protein G6F56_009777 [Rhizopus delemar]
MAIVRYFGKSSLFITYTANPRWEEITAELSPGQTAIDRPDLVCRVLNLKRDEFDTAEKLDNAISACIPSKENDAELHEIITKNMMHSTINTNSPCMIKDINGEWQFEMTNEWVVLYDPHLSKKYKAHINVESCASVQAIKYINIYVYKGQDRSTVALSDTPNEIHRYLQGRYIGPTEAFWRLFEYPIHEEDPTVMHLSFHLPDHQTVYFPDDASNEEVRTILDKSKSHLMAWFDYNRSDSDGREFLYQELPEHYVYDGNLRN